MAVWEREPWLQLDHLDGDIFGRVPFQSLTFGLHNVALSSPFQDSTCTSTKAAVRAVEIKFAASHGGCCIYPSRLGPIGATR